MHYNTATPSFKDKYEKEAKRKFLVKQTLTTRDILCRVSIHAIVLFLYNRRFLKHVI